MARSDVAFQVEDLLPGSQDKGPVLYRHRERRTQHSCLQVRMAIPVMPGLFVPIVAARGKEPVQSIRQIFLESRLEFDGPDRRGAADTENVGQPGFDTGSADNLADFLRQIVHGAMSGGLDLNFSLVNHGFLPPVAGYQSFRETFPLGIAFLPTPAFPVAGTYTLILVDQRAKVTLVRTEGRVLFTGDMATIDVIVRREGNHYYGILKEPEAIRHSGGRLWSSLLEMSGLTNRILRETTRAASPRIA